MEGETGMKLLWVGMTGLTAAAAIFAGQALGQTGPDKARGEAIFKERCKDCHEPAVDRAPTREELAAKPPAEIVAALTTGPMAPVAEGLTPDEKQAVAAYLTSY